MVLQVCNRSVNTSICRRFNNGPKLPPCNFIPSKYEGPSLEKIKNTRSTNFPPAIYTMYKKPILLHQGRMQWLFDQNNKRYLDLIGGICTVSVGHCHPKITEAVMKQMNLVWHTTNLYNHPSIHEYIEKLVAKMPGELKVVYLVNSGTEANDLAMILARAYTGNQDIITLRNSYHGYSSAMMGLTATRAYRMPMPVLAGIHHAMLPDPYRGIWKGCRDSVSQVPGSCNCPGDCISTDNYIAQLNEILEQSVPSGKLAAMFAESIQGVGGTIQYPKGYLRKAKELVNKNGGLFVSDEVQTGFGRTGDHFWGFEGHGMVPDIVTMAKGIGNGFPLGAVVTTADIAAAHTKALYFNTFGGNAIAATVGKSVLEILDEEGLQENSKEVGTFFITQLLKLRDSHPIVGDVRGKGLMIGFELVEPGTNIPLNMSEVLNVMEMTKETGVLFGRGGRHGNVIRIKPPMCITKDDVEFSVSVLDEVLKFTKSPKSFYQKNGTEPK